MNHLSAEEIIQYKEKYFFQNGMHFYKNPPHFVKGEMQYLFDDKGKKYTDFFGGVTVANCGHCNEEISERVSEQVKTLQHTSIIYLTEPMVLLAEKLSQRLPEGMNRTFFCCSGTEANEGALVLARMHTGRRGFIAFKGGLHGRSHLTMSVTGIPMWRIDPYLESCVYFADSFYQVGEDEAATSERVLKQIEEILIAHASEIAACIVEPIQGNGGILTAPKGFFKQLKNLLEKYGVLLIFDEVQTGFGRTGTFFALEHEAVIPDILTMAKALGNGAPIGAFSATETVAESMIKPSASTLGGNPVSMVAGLAVLDYLEKNDMAGRSKYLGEKLKEGLICLKNKHRSIKDVRGRGLMIGAEIESQDPSHSHGQLVDMILEMAKDRGFIIGKNGVDRNVLAFQPPMVLELADIEALLKCLDEIFTEKGL